MCDYSCNSGARDADPLSNPPGIQNNRVFRKEQPKVASREMFYLEGRSLHHQPQKRKLQCQLPQLIDNSNFDNISFDNINTNGGAFNFAGAQDVGGHGDVQSADL